MKEVKRGTNRIDPFRAEKSHTRFMPRVFRGLQVLLEFIQKQWGFREIFKALRVLIIFGFGVVFQAALWAVDSVEVGWGTET